MNWVFEGQILNHAKNPTVIQVNLHSYERTPTGAVVEVNWKLNRVCAVFRGARALIEGHRCIADALEAIARHADEAHPEAFDVRVPELLHHYDRVEVRIDGRVGDALVAFAACFGPALDEPIRLVRKLGAAS